jgi:hypothetical protein
MRRGLVKLAAAKAVTAVGADTAPVVGRVEGVMAPAEAATVRAVDQAEVEAEAVTAAPVAPVEEVTARGQDQAEAEAVLVPAEGALTIKTSTITKIAVGVASAKEVEVVAAPTRVADQAGADVHTKDS